MSATPEHAITTVDELTALVGEPREATRNKVRTSLLDPDLRWLARSPFCVLATSDAAGRCDASPKGDPAGRLVHVIDDRTIAIAERPGNRRVDGYLNVLENPHVGLLFVVPGRSDTLRVNGRGRLVSDATWFDELVVKGHRPLLALVVDVEEVFTHCAKALVRAGLWHPGSWDPRAVDVSRPAGSVGQNALEDVEDAEDAEDVDTLVTRIETQQVSGYSVGLY